MLSIHEAVKAIPAGRYIVAVSGGVDSMVLLDALRRRTDVDLIVAHANHGIRSDSHLDEQLIATFCRSHNIECVSKELHLKQNASEAHARDARYEFLQTCRIVQKADAIITAHHQDDLLETAVINLMRGTGWRGIAPFASGKTILRPLVEVSKSDLIMYAAKNAVPFREDSTNATQNYLRNYIRLTVIPALDQRNSDWQADILRLIRNQVQLRRTIEAELDMALTSHILRKDGKAVSERYMWCMLPRTTGYELLQQLFRSTLGYSLVRELADAALLFAKVAKPGKRMVLGDDWQLRVTHRALIVEPRISVVK
jgi:tRNA(Ile)-lysidine synthase